MMDRCSSGSLAASSHVAALVAVVGVLAAPAAEACGCFAPPSAAEVVVQAGERILFAVESG